MFLITYRCKSDSGLVTWGYTIEEDAEKWVIETQKYIDEVYYIINVLPVSAEFAEKYDGWLKGT